MEPLKVLASPSVAEEKEESTLTSLGTVTPPQPLLPRSHAPYSLAVTPGLVLPLSGSRGKAGSRGVKSRSAPGPTSKSFRPSTEGEEEGTGTGDSTEWDSSGTQ